MKVKVSNLVPSPPYISLFSQNISKNLGGGENSNDEIETKDCNLFLSGLWFVYVIEGELLRIDLGLDLVLVWELQRKLLLLFLLNVVQRPHSTHHLDIHTLSPHCLQTKECRFAGCP